METGNVITCDRCGKVLNSGDPAWQMQLTLTSDVVQGMGAFQGASQEDIDQRIQNILDRIKVMPGEMLENEVFQEFKFVLCRRCRDIVAANPLRQEL